MLQSKTFPLEIAVPFSKSQTSHTFNIKNVLFTFTYQGKGENFIQRLLSLCPSCTVKWGPSERGPEPTSAGTMNMETTWSRGSACTPAAPAPACSARPRAPSISTVAAAVDRRRSDLHRFLALGTKGEPAALANTPTVAVRAFSTNLLVMQISHARLMVTRELWTSRSWMLFVLGLLHEVWHRPVFLETLRESSTQGLGRVPPGPSWATEPTRRSTPPLSTLWVPLIAFH